MGLDAGQKLNVWPKGTVQGLVYTATNVPKEPHRHSPIPTKNAPSCGGVTVLGLGYLKQGGFRVEGLRFRVRNLRDILGGSWAVIRRAGVKPGIQGESNEI